MTGQQNRTLLIFILALTAAAAFVTFSPKVRAYYGLDINGGARVVLRAKTEEYERTEHKRWSAENLESVRRILDNRVNFQGVSEPLLISRPPDQVIVELPGLKNTEEAVTRLQSTASLQFYLLPQLGNKDGTAPATWRLSKETDKATGQETEILADAMTGKPLSPEDLESRVFSNDPIETGKDLLPKSRAVIQGTGSPVIEFQFNSVGQQKFEEVTRANIGKYLAIFLDKKLLTAPTINSVIPGQGIIEGSFTLESAKSLADQLNAGALPVPLETIEVRKLEATLGQGSVAATKVAGMIGLGLILLFMVLYYRLPGLLANIALVLYAIFSIALFKLWPITLTLPGIAGFILSIGMAVDANILIFERLKEELRSGKTLRAAIDAGFKRAFTAIFDSNVCTIITCGVLYYFGTGPIRGFALTLGLGVLVSMFTAITVTRTLLFTLVSFPNSFAQNQKLYNLGAGWHPNLGVMRKKWLWLGISLAIIVPGLIFWLGANGIKKSIDFTGGTEMQVPFAQRYTSDTITRALNRPNSRVVVSTDSAGSAQVAFITLPRLTAAERQETIAQLISKVGPLAPGLTEANVQFADVSGTVSKQLTFEAIEAVLVASLFIVLYLAARFSIGGFKEGLKYGICAVIALLHDVLVLWGAFAILGYFLNWQIDSLFVTAMLTVIGFSVHDTIIIFDRMRENLRIRQRSESFSDLADRSIDQTISRSINTSFTVVLVLLALFFRGGSAVHQFTGALLIGIISGTYSSIFNASVLLVLWKQRDMVTGIQGARGTRPAVTPSRPLAAAAAEGGSLGDDGESAERKRAERSAAARKQPVRRRRM